MPNLKIKSFNRIVLTLKDSKGDLKMFLITGGGERSSLKLKGLQKRHASDIEFFSLVISNKLSTIDWCLMFFSRLSKGSV